MDSVDPIPDVSELLPLDAGNENSASPTLTQPGYPNLHRFPKGKSGNPKGGSKSKLISNAFAHLLAQRVPDDVLEKAGLKQKPNGPPVKSILPKKATYAHLVAWSAIQHALAKGNMAALKEVINRTEGRVPKELHEANDDRLDELMAALAIPPAAPGETNE
jgi:hypothetical protein